MFGRKNRGKIEIMADILNLSASGLVRKTHIMYRINLSYKQTLCYLEELQSRDFLEEYTEEDTPAYRVTEKGRKFLDIFMNISALMDGKSIELYERRRMERG
jgi:predicted transcriptional regulator